MKVKHWMTIYQKKYRYVKTEKEFSEMDITSLLDVLVILLFFLILNYNPTDLQIDLADKTLPPPSQLMEYGNQAVMIQINQDKEFFLGKTKIGSLTSKSDLSKIAKALKESKAMQEEQFKKMNREVASTHDPLNINIIFDGDLEFEVIDQVMKIAAKQGFANFKLIVMAGKYDE